jgi:hypothetical protein
MDDDAAREAGAQRRDDMCLVLYELQEAMRAALVERFPRETYGDMPATLFGAAVRAMMNQIDLLDRREAPAGSAQQARS